MSMPVDESTVLTATASRRRILHLALETTEDIALHWKWILIAGLVNLVMGTACLLFPIWATQVVGFTLTIIVLITGICNIMLALSMQHSFVWLGCFQILIAIFMYMHPLFTLTALTLVIAILFMMLGTAQIILVRLNRQQAGRALALFSGLLAIVMSIFIIAFMPMTTWYTIGTLLGVNLINIGLARIVLACYGQSLAAVGGTDSTETSGWQNYVEADYI